MLGFEGATYGYSAEGLKALIEKINLECITETTKSLKSGLTELYASVDATWAGESAKKFKEKLSTDASSIIDSIQNAGKMCEASLQHVGGSMRKVDEEIKL